MGALMFGLVTLGGPAFRLKRAGTACLGPVFSAQSEQERLLGVRIMFRMTSVVQEFWVWFQDVSDG